MDFVANIHKVQSRQRSIYQCTIGFLRIVYEGSSLATNSITYSSRPGWLYKLTRNQKTGLLFANRLIGLFKFQMLVKNPY
jgi:hypothetical protein